MQDNESAPRLTGIGADTTEYPVSRSRYVMRPDGKTRHPRYDGERVNGRRM